MYPTEWWWAERQAAAAYILANLQYYTVYTAPKVNPYLRIQTEPVLDGVDPMVVNVCMACV